MNSISTKKYKILKKCPRCNKKTLTTPYGLISKSKGIFCFIPLECRNCKYSEELSYEKYIEEKYKEER